MDAIALGDAAQRLLDDEAMYDTLNGLRRDSMAEWVDSLTVEEREKCWSDYQALERVISRIERLRANGQIARQDRDRA